MFKVIVSKTEGFTEIDFEVKDFDSLHSLLAELLSTEKSDELVFTISTVSGESDNDVDG